MRLKDTSKIQPQKDRVLVDIKTKVIDQDGLYIGEDKSGNYIGEVVKLGPNATEDPHCPNLKEGDLAIFSEFSGHHISTDTSIKLKVIPGYDIIATVSDQNNINEQTLTATADRVLVSVKMTDESEDGLVIDAEEAKDPKLTDLDYGVIIQTGPVAKMGLQVGQLVAYEPWCGTVVKQRAFTGDSELKLIREDDILFIAG